MRIHRNKKKHGNLEPEVYNLLKVLPENILLHKEHVLRRPSNIYFLSLLKVKDSMIEICEELSRISKSIDSFEYEKLLLAQERLLHSLLSHIDDCYLILKALHPKIETKTIRHADQWLEHVQHPTIKEFKKNIENYRKFISLIVNKMKHEHARLRPMRYYDKAVYAVGYYVEGVDQEGVVGPNPLIHPGGDTAFSFNRDMKFHLYSVYKVSFYLTKAIRGAIKKIHNLDLPLTPFFEIDESLEEKTVRVLESVHLLPYRFFLDEKEKPVPEITLKQNPQNTLVVLNMPSKIKPLLPYPMRVSTSFTIDGTHRVPYLDVSKI